MVSGDKHMTKQRATEVLAEIAACYASEDPMEFKYTSTREEQDEANAMKWAEQQAEIDIECYRDAEGHRILA
jgi:hypothetical protein